MPEGPPVGIEQRVYLKGSQWFNQKTLKNATKMVNIEYFCGADLSYDFIFSPESRGFANLL